MSKFRKKPVVIEAITFDELVCHGLAHSSNIVNGLPWSFDYNGHPITHETDDCYLIPTLEGTMKMGRTDMLLTGVKGEIYPCKADIFAATYEPADSAPQSFQDRVKLEKAELDDKRQKLTAFILGNAAYRTLPQTEQSRLNRQLEAMTLYSNILKERIASFS